MGVKNEKDENSLDFIKEYKTGAITIVTFVIFVYLLTLPNLKEPFKTIGDMGALGDFFGGILNPTFSLIALFALLATIKIQSKALNISSEELKLTRNELSLTRGEIAKATTAQQEQSQSIKIQNFENTFFNMLNLHNEIINNLILSHKEFSKRSVPDTTRMSFKTIDIPQNYKIGSFEIDLDDKGNYSGRKAHSKLLQILKQYIKEKDVEDFVIHEELYNHFHNEYQDIIGHYFGTIYQILKFINDSHEESKINNPNRYAYLFRSQFSKPELELLFYHGFSEIGREKLLPLLSKFEFFEHLPYSKEIDNQYIDLYMKYEEGKVFGDNINWLFRKSDPKGEFETV